MNFLKAEWKNLALFNYEVDAKILENMFLQEPK